jgi:hypothetical protein
VSESSPRLAFFMQTNIIVGDESAMNWLEGSELLRTPPYHFMYVVQVHILDDAQGSRGWLENASPHPMAVEESPLGPLCVRRP